jgi:cell division transport system ATP-binding protein
MLNGGLIPRGASKPRGQRKTRKGYGPAVLRVDNIGLRYGAGPEVLKHVSFRMRPGDFMFLTGPSGAGKTSLLRLLFLAQRPSKGTLKLFGTHVGNLERSELPRLRRRIGVVFQDFRLLEHLSVFDNVALPLRVAGQRLVQYRQDVLDLIDWVGLAPKAGVYPDTLSGGEKQRAAIARAVIAKPDLLLADEPTGNVDPVLARRLLHLFAALNQQGTTVLIASHDESLMKAMQKPILRLQDGVLRR